MRDAITNTVSGTLCGVWRACAVRANEYSKRHTAPCKPTNLTSGKCCFVYFFLTIQSKNDNVLSFLKQKAYSGIRLIDYSVGFYEAPFSHVRMST